MSLRPRRQVRLMAPLPRGRASDALASLPADLPLRCGGVRIVRMRAGLIFVLCALSWPASARAEAPANDAFSAAQPITTGVPVTGDTTEASAEPGEPVHATWLAPNRSVWFKWTPSASGLARVSACGSAFDTVVAVYGGSELAGIYATRLANNDDGCGDGASMVHLRVTAGTTYRIVLDGWSGGPGSPSRSATRE